MRGKTFTVQELANADKTFSEALDEAMSRRATEVMLNEPAENNDDEDSVGAGGERDDLSPGQLKTQRLLLGEFPTDAGMHKYGDKMADWVLDKFLLPESRLFPCQRVGFKPKWHQIVGGAEAVDRAFTGDNTRGDPTLLADQVGMGKTSQVLLIWQFLCQLRILQQKEGGPWPSVLGEYS